ncbi:MAG: hypothetical protein AAB286_06170, partial [Pseudomonadota bacterium]
NFNKAKYIIKYLDYSNLTQPLSMVLCFTGPVRRKKAVPKDGFFHLRLPVVAFGYFSTIWQEREREQELRLLLPLYQVLHQTLNLHASPTGWGGIALVFLPQVFFPASGHKR